MSKEIKKEYSNGEITIVWQPNKCIHSGICVRTLPEVYKPNEKPWIQIENASTEALKDQVAKCPSAALTYYVNGDQPSDEPVSETKVSVMENGPLLVHGDILVTDKDGNTTTKKKTTAFCRCGASGNKPYCDGAHKNIDFRG